MKLVELLSRMGVEKYTLKPGIKKEAEIILMPEESDGFDVSDVIYFNDEGQMWLVIDEHGERWLTQDEEEDNPVGEREGDMCCLPEISGDVKKCPNPCCNNGMTKSGPCLRCQTVEQPKFDICEQARLRAKRA